MRHETTAYRAIRWGFTGREPRASDRVLLIYGTGIRNARNPFILNEYTSLIYGRPGFRTFPFLAISSLSCLPLPASATRANAKINRYTEKIEHLVSHRKQRTDPQINRHTLAPPRFPFSHSPNSPVAGLENDPEPA